jgi:hypothetical protein
MPVPEDPVALGYSDASKKGVDWKEREKKRAGKKYAGKNFVVEKITRRQYRAKDNCARAKIPRRHLAANTQKTAVQKCRALWIAQT